MKTKNLYILIILAMCASLLGTAATPAKFTPEASIKSVTLIQSTFVEEKGMFFKFQVTGTFKEKELKGTLLVAGKTIKLRCRAPKTSDMVQCTAPGGTSANYAGQSAVVALNGFGFWITVPNKKEACPHCQE